jgi:ECF sigma factor
LENSPSSNIFEQTRLLKAWSEGDETALERLIPLVDAELRRLAHHYLRQERPDHILQMRQASTISLALLSPI